STRAEASGSETVIVDPPIDCERNQYVGIQVNELVAGDELIVTISLIGPTGLYSTYTAKGEKGPAVGSLVANFKIGNIPCGDYNLIIDEAKLNNKIYSGRNSVYHIATHYVRLLDKADFK
ncbi:MAG: hypothetical protein ACKVQC_01340, partial [Elusimicrobiota bacterium]